MLGGLGDLASGAWDYMTDPTGMDAYRKGMAKNEAAQRAEQDAVRGRLDPLAQQYMTTGQDMSGLYGQTAGLGSVGMQGMVQDYSVDPTMAQYQGNVNQFLDPSIAYQQEQAQRGIESSAAARGNLMSGAAAKAIADRAQQIGQQGYADAYARMERDRANFQQQGQQGYINQNQQAQQRFQQQQLLAQLGLQGLAGQERGMQYGTTGYVNTQLPGATLTVDPTAGLGDIRAGEMRGQFTQGVFDALGDLAKSYIGQKI
jgi:hypothetical protein